MKKTCFLLFASVCLMPAAYADTSASPFDGFYVGGELGVNQQVYDVNNAANLALDDGSAINIKASQNESTRSLAPIGGLVLGYGKTFNQFYLGVRLNADLTYAKDSLNDVLASTNPGSIATFRATNQVNVKASNDLGAVLQPGFLLTPDTLLYGLVGTQVSSLSLTTQANFEDIPITSGGNVAVSGSQSQAIWGIRAGLGVEQYWAHGISFGVEYDFTSYEHASVSAQGTGTVSSIDYTASSYSKISPFTNTLMAHINYHFA